MKPRIRVPLSEVGKSHYHLQKLMSRHGQVARINDVVLSTRTTAMVKSRIQKTAESERRSLASVIEVKALNYAERRGGSNPRPKVPSKGKK